MATLIVELPREWEADVKVDKETGRIEITPNFAAGAVKAPCLYLTTEGQRGMQRRSMIVLNGNSGWTEMRRITKTDGKCLFDLPQDEYEKQHGDDDDE